MGDKTAIATALIVLGVILGVYGAIAYVAWHFVTKYW